MGLLVVCLLAGPVVAGAQHELELELGMGYDDNPYLTPDAPYFDQNRQEIVDPRRESGWLLPLRLDGELRLPLGPGGRQFVTEYRLKGGRYAEAETRNADELYARVQPGLSLKLGNHPRRERLLDLSAFAAYDKEIYFDRDTGLGATSSGIDLADRFTYTAVGAEAVLSLEASSRVTLTTELMVEQRTYEDVAPVEAFDHDRYRARAGIALRLARAARAFFEYGYEVREYDERHARGLDGDDPVQNPLLEYAHTTLSTGLRFKPARPWTVGLEWTRRERDDRFLGYNSYTQDRLRIRATHRSDRLWARLTASYSERDFERAFIFDQPIDPMTGQLNELKTYETLELEFHGYLPWKRHLRPFTRLRYVDQRTADPRFDYDRSQAMLGLELLY